MSRTRERRDMLARLPVLNVGHTLALGGAVRWDRDISQSRGIDNRAKWQPPTVKSGLELHESVFFQ